MAAASARWQAQSPSEEALSPGAAAFRALRSATNREDQHGTVEALRDLWSADPTRGAQASLDIILRGSPYWRVLGVAALARHGTADQIDRAIGALSPGHHRSERWALVRALDGKDPEQVRTIAPRYLRDSEVLVQVAAIAALAGTGDPTVARHFIGSLPPLPTIDAAVDAEYARTLTMYGALRRLTGISFRDQAAALNWWRRGSEIGSPGTDPRSVVFGLRREPNWRFEFATAHFRGRLAMRRIDDLFVNAAPWTRRSEAWGGIVSAVDAGAADGFAKASRIFGRTTLPLAELVVADSVNFVREFALMPESEVNGEAHHQVLLLASSDRTMQVEAARRAVTLAEKGTLPDLPRWLTWGLVNGLVPGCSACAGGRCSGAPGGGVPSASLLRLLESGAVTRGTASDEPMFGRSGDQLWWLGNAAVLFMLGGGFAEPEMRMTLLAARLNFGVPSRVAIQEMYGAPVQELDRRVMAWALDGGLRRPLEWLEAGSAESPPRN
ncbi:MAG TPA: hypothetical protein DEB06_11430 [Phycisphaerales bacterium]|nr:hypothetical protein [Phycisphaerales bacterium]